MSYEVGLAAAAAVTASAHTATSHASGHAAARARGTATTFTGTCAPQCRPLAPAVGANRTFANAPIACADVDGCARSMASVNAPIPNNVDTDRDATVAVSI